MSAPSATPNLFQSRMIVRRRKLTLLAQAEQGLASLLRSRVNADGLVDRILNCVATVDAIERETPQPGDTLIERVAVDFDHVGLILARCGRATSTHLRALFTVDDVAITHNFGRASARVLDLRRRVTELANLLGLQVVDVVDLFDDSPNKPALDVDDDLQPHLLLELAGKAFSKRSRTKTPRRRTKRS